MVDHLPPQSRNSRGPAHWTILLLLFGVGLLVRLHHLTAPPLDFHSLRQFDYVIVAHADYVDLRPEGQETRRNIAGRNRVETLQLEPRILPRLASILYSLHGKEALWIPRLLSIAFWLVTSWLIYLIALRLGDPASALCSTGIYLFTPFGIMASRSFQPDPLMIMLSTGAVWLFLRHYDRPTVANFMAASAVGALTVFVKPMGLFSVAGAFLGLEIFRCGWLRTLRGWRPWAFALIAVVPAGLYYFFAIMRTQDMKGQATQSFSLELFVQWYFFPFWMNMLGRVVGLVPLALAVIATALDRQRERRALLIALWASYLLYAFTFNFHIYTHDYYSLPVIRIVALALGPVVAAALYWLRKDASWRVLAGGSTVLALCFGGMVATRVRSAGMAGAIKESAFEAASWMGISKKFVNFALMHRAELDEQVRVMKEIGEKVGHSTRTVIIDSEGGRALRYYGEICGYDWFILRGAVDNRPAAEIEAELKERLDGVLRRTRGEFFVVTDLYQFTVAQPWLKNVLDREYPIFAKDKTYVIYDLRKPGEAPRS